MNNSIKETWHGLTGAQVREIIRKTEQKAEDAINTVNTVVQANDEGKLQILPEYLPSYVDDVIEGYYNNIDNDDIDNGFYADSSYKTAIKPEIGKIYVDLNTDHTYRWSGSVYIEISSGDEIQQRLDNFNKQKNTSIETVISDIQKEVDGKVTKDPNKDLSKNDYTDDEKNKFTIVDTLPSTDYTDKVYYLKQDNGSYLKGLYYHNGTGWQRVGGLL
jgi:hypothetical protein